MIDWIVLGLLAGFALRGWWRGFVGQLVDLAALVLGAMAALRFAGSAGSVVERLVGWPELTARMAGAAVLLVAVAVGAAVVGRLVRGALRRLPGLSVLDRLAGSVLGLAVGALAATLLVTFLAVLPLPDAVGTDLDRSSLAGQLVDPSGPTQRLLAGLAGDRVISSLLALRSLVGEGAIALPADETWTLPPLGPLDARPAAAAADAGARALDRARTEAGVDPWLRLPGLDVVATGVASDAYRAGGPIDDVGGRTTAGGVDVHIRGVAYGIGATSGGAVEALVESTAYRDLLTARAPTRFGIGVAAGPYGTLVVIIVAD